MTYRIDSDPQSTHSKPKRQLMKSIAFTHMLIALVGLNGFANDAPNRPQQNGDSKKDAQQNQTDEVEQSTVISARGLEVQYIPTPQPVVNLMLRLADVKETDLLYDLGCGDGRIVISAAKKYGCRAVGVDIDPDRVRESLENVKAANLEHLVTIKQEDIFKLDLSEADVVTMYLLPHLNIRLIPQLKTMKPGSRIVSHDFDMEGVEPDALVNCSNRWDRAKLYLWETPLNDKRKIAITALPPVRVEKPFTLQHVLLIVATVALCLAAFFWLLSKRLGRINFRVTIDRN